jgi:hypothetical protein
MEVLQIRQTVATTVGTVDGSVTITPSGGSLTDIIDLLLFTNVVGDAKQANVGGSFTIKPGDVITGTTFDSSTGGTVSYDVIMDGIEFDA